jgi:hypothetical protein
LPQTVDADLQQRVDFLEPDAPPAGVMAPFSFMVKHEINDINTGNGSVRTRFDYSGTRKETAEQPVRSLHFFIVMKIIPINMLFVAPTFILKFYVYEAGYVNVNPALLDAAPSHSVVPFASTMSIAMSGFFVSQVRAGTTFGSVYDDIPSSLTTTSPTPSGQPPTSPTPKRMTTTAASSSSGTVSNTSTTRATTGTSGGSATIGTLASSSSGARTNATTSNATPSATTTTTRTLETCETDSMSTCSSCLENHGCKWCSTTAESESTAGRCVESNIDGCERLVLATTGCAIADEQMAAVPIAVIAGASVGGVVLILLIIAVVVCLVMRARSQSKQKSAKSTEMTTARESHSIAASGDENNYGDLRLTSVYSTAGLGTPASSSAGSALAASTGSAPHYSPMQMR